MNNEVKTINGYDIKDVKAIRTYDTVALLKADRKLKQGQHVKTRGYYSINDGGGAEYYITSTQSQLDFQENLENGLYANLHILNGVIKAEQVGIKGNTNDNSNCNELLTTLLNYASENNYTIEFMKKIYTCFNVHIPANTRINGNGATFKKPNFKIEPYNLLPNVYGWYGIFLLDKQTSNDEPLPIIIKDCIFDGNCWEIWSIEEGFSQQQGSLITAFGNESYTSRINAYFYNVTVQNNSSDGFHIRSQANVYIENAKSFECFRGGLTCTGGGSKVKVNGFEFNGNLLPDGIDLENDSQSHERNEYYFENITINNDLDLAEPGDNTLLCVNNMVSKGEIIIRGTTLGVYISNSYFKISDSTKNFLINNVGENNKKMVFTNCIFDGTIDPTTQEGTSISMMHVYPGSASTNIKAITQFKSCEFKNLYTISGGSHINGQIDFINCKFDSSITGTAIGNTGIVQNADFSPRILNIIDCTFDNANYIARCQGYSSDIRTVNFINNRITNTSNLGLDIYRALVNFDQTFIENGWSIHWRPDPKYRLFGKRTFITTDTTKVPTNTIKGVHGNDTIIIMSSDYQTPLAKFIFDDSNSTWSTVFNNIE